MLSGLCCFPSKKKKPLGNPRTGSHEDVVRLFLERGPAPPRPPPPPVGPVRDDMSRVGSGAAASLRPLRPVDVPHPRARRRGQPGRGPPPPPCPRCCRAGGAERSGPAPGRRAARRRPRPGSIRPRAAGRTQRPSREGRCGRGAPWPGPGPGPGRRSAASASCCWPRPGSRAVRVSAPGPGPAAGTPSLSSLLPVWQAASGPNSQPGQRPRTPSLAPPRGSGPPPHSPSPGLGLALGASWGGGGGCGLAAPVPSSELPGPGLAPRASRWGGRHPPPPPSLCQSRGSCPAVPVCPPQCKGISPSAGSTSGTWSQRGGHRCQKEGAVGGDTAWALTGTISAKMCLVNVVRGQRGAERTAGPLS